MLLLQPRNELLLLLHGGSLPPQLLRGLQQVLRLPLDLLFRLWEDIEVELRQEGELPACFGLLIPAGFSTGPQCQDTYSSFSSRVNRFSACMCRCTYFVISAEVLGE